MRYFLGPVIVLIVGLSLVLVATVYTSDKPEPAKYEVYMPGAGKAEALACYWDRDGKEPVLMCVDIIDFIEAYNATGGGTSGTTEL